MTLIAPALQDRKLLSYASLYTSNLNLPVGKLNIKPCNTQVTVAETGSHIPVIVCGAHLEDLPLNWQLIERGAVCKQKTTTLLNYKLYVSPGGPPQRPGLVRSEESGVALWISTIQVAGAHI